jgi:hypothetical protein
MSGLSASGYNGLPGRAMKAAAQPAPQSGRRDLKIRRHVTVDFRLVFELANRVDRVAPFEVLALEWAQGL